MSARIALPVSSTTVAPNAAPNAAPTVAPTAAPTAASMAAISADARRAPADTGAAPWLPAATAAPRFAVVLGSGGVRSISALGLFEVLSREGLRPDLIVGCSAGALFGALMAAGHAVDDAVQLATTLWSADVTRQRRWQAMAQMLWPRLAGFDADFSLRRDTRVMARLQQAFGDARLEALPIALRVATTDAATGRRVVLAQGPLVPALRASIALPFMFAPVQIGGRRLIDGFVADPLPVSAAADARAVLAMGFEAPMPRRIDRPSRLLAQVTSALTNNLMQARLAAADSRHVLALVPPLERRIGLFDTGAIPGWCRLAGVRPRRRCPTSTPC